MSKSTALEREVKVALEAEGYLVHRTIRAPIMGPGGKVIGSHSNDVFGAFDIIAANTVHLRFIQVTTTDGVPARAKKVAGIIRDRWPANMAIRVELWGWVGGRKRRNKQTGEFIRRQYFRTFDWNGAEWIDMTPPGAGRQDSIEEIQRGVDRATGAA